MMTTTTNDEDDDYGEDENHDADDGDIQSFLIFGFGE